MDDSTEIAMANGGQGTPRELADSLEMAVVSGQQDAPRRAAGRSDVATGQSSNYNRRTRRPSVEFRHDDPAAEASDGRAIPSAALPQSRGIRGLVSRLQHPPAHPQRSEIRTGRQLMEERSRHWANPAFAGTTPPSHTEPNEYINMVVAASNDTPMSPHLSAKPSKSPARTLLRTMSMEEVSLRAAGRRAHLTSQPSDLRALSTHALRLDPMEGPRERSNPLGAPTGVDQPLPPPAAMPLARPKPDLLQPGPLRDDLTSAQGLSPSPREHCEQPPGPPARDVGVLGRDRGSGGTTQDVDAGQEHSQHHGQQREASASAPVEAQAPSSRGSPTVAASGEPAQQGGEQAQEPSVVGPSRRASGLPRLRPSQDWDDSASEGTDGDTTQRDEADEDENGTRGRCYIHPDHTFRRGWDLLQLTLLMYICAILPLRIGMDMPATGAWVGIELVIDVLFMVDVLLNLRTAYVDSEGHLHHGFCEIATQYLRTWMVIDVVSAIPFDLIMASDESGASYLKFGRMLRAIRAAKLLRFAKMSGLIRRFEDEMVVNRTVLKLVKLLLLTMAVCHFNACAWHFVAVNSGSTVTWVTVAGLDEASVSDRYISALYWSATTIVTVGYGDITPENNAEKIFSILSMMTGGGFFGYALASVGSLVASLDANSRLIQEKMDSVNAYMSSRKLPPDLRRRVRRYYRTYLEKRTAFDEREILSELNTFLRQEVALRIIHDVIFNNPLFKHLEDPHFLSQLLPILKPLMCASGDLVCEAGERGREMFFVIRGSLVVRDAMGRFVARLHRGDFFGELAAVGLQSVRTITVQARRECELYSLARDDLYATFAHDPDILARMRDAVRVRHGMTPEQGESVKPDFTAVGIGVHMYSPPDREGGHEPCDDNNAPDRGHGDFARPSRRELVLQAASQQSHRRGTRLARMSRVSEESSAESDGSCDLQGRAEACGDLEVGATSRHHPTVGPRSDTFVHSASSSDSEDDSSVVTGPAAEDSIIAPPTRNDAASATPAGLSAVRKAAGETAVAAAAMAEPNSRLVVHHSRSVGEARSVRGVGLKQQVGDAPRSSRRVARGWSDKAFGGVAMVPRAASPPSVVGADEAREPVHPPTSRRHYSVDSQPVHYLVPVHPSALTSPGFMLNMASGPHGQLSAPYVDETVALSRQTSTDIKTRERGGSLLSHASSTHLRAPTLMRSHHGSLVLPSHPPASMPTTTTAPADRAHK